MLKNFIFLAYASLSTASMVFLMILLSSQVKGEQFQYYLNVIDKMKSEWPYADFSGGSKIQCASLCHRQKDQCSYFGYKEGHCYLMTDSLDESKCSEDECSDPGMKIYKLKLVDIPTTSTIQPSTKVTDTTSTTIKTSTTETTTTSEKPETTTKEPSSSTSTTLSPTTQKVSTSEKPETTSTTEATTTTAATTSTTEATTSTTEATTTTAATTSTTAATTSTTEATTTTAATTSTTAATTSTTEATTPSGTSPETTTVTTSTEDTTSTSTLAPSTTAGAFNCDPPNGAEAGAECPMQNFLLNSLGSKSPFFGDALSPKCYDFKEKLYDDSVDEIYYFFSLNGGLSMSAMCPKDNNLIIQYKLCVMDKKIMAITIHCSPILDLDRIEDVFNATSEEYKDGLVNCRDKAGLQKIYMLETSTPITRVIFQCVLFSVPDNEVAEVAGENDVG